MGQVNTRKASHLTLLRKQPNDTLTLDRLQKSRDPLKLARSRKSIVEGSLRNPRTCDQAFPGVLRLKHLWGA